MCWHWVVTDDSFFRAYVLKTNQIFLSVYGQRRNAFFSIYNKKAMGFTMYMSYFSVLTGVCLKASPIIFLEQHEPKK